MVLLSYLREALDMIILLNKISLAYGGGYLIYICDARMVKFGNIP